MKTVDSVTIAATRRTADGYLVADCQIARTGIQDYAGSEVGKPELPIVRVYRSGDEVFSNDTLKSFAHKPVTVDHPAEAVNSDNWKAHAVGQIGDEILGTGKFIRVPLMVSDGAAIADIEAGKAELSAGYWHDLDWTPGVTPDGQAYDAKQTNIRANHVAVVDKGRAGSECRIGMDADKWGVAPKPPAEHKELEIMPDTLQTVVVGDSAINVAAVDVAKLDAWKTAQAKIASDAKIAFDEALAAKDKELAEKDAEIAKLKEAQVDEAGIAKRVAERVALETDAAKVDDKVEVEGLSNDELRKAVVVAKLGEDSIKDRSDEYVTARFDTLVEDAGEIEDPFRKSMKSRDKQASNDAWSNDFLAASGVAVKKGA